MKKFYLTATAVFILILAGNALGQWHPDIDKVKIKAKPTKTKPKGSTSFTEVSGLGSEAKRRKHPRRKSAQYNPKEVGIDKIKARKPTSFTSAEGRSLDFELRRKHPRKRKN